MDATQIHTSLNYIPVLGMFLGTVLLLLGLWKKNDRVNRLSLGLFSLTALLALAVYGSGEVAGKGADLMVGQAWTNISHHRASAMPAFAAMAITGIFAFIGLISMLRGSGLPRWNVLAVLLLSLAAFGLTARTTYLGMYIHFVEATANK